MPAPILPILIGVAAIAGLAMANKKGAPKPGQATGPYQLDANLPADTRQAVIIALNTETDSGKLRTFASALRGEGFPLAAQQLETKANALDAMNGVQPQTPIVPDAPPAIPPAPNQPPVVIPSAPPVLVTPSQPDFPEVPQPSPPGQATLPTTVVTGQSNYDPGPFPGLGTPRGSNAALNKSLQGYLQDFYSLVNVNFPDGATQTSMRDPQMGVIDYAGVDGVWGPKSQFALWGFQRWSNDNTGTALSEDGTPGPASLAAIQAWAAAAGAPSH